MNEPRLVLGIDEPPGYGGASTVAYQLHAQLLARGQASTLCCIWDSQADQHYQKLLGSGFANPQNLSQVYRETESSIGRRLQQLKPEVMVGFSATSAVKLKASAPGVCCIFRSSGLGQAQFWSSHASPRSAQELNALLDSYPNLKLPTFGAEKTAINRSDYVLCPSPMLIDFYHRFFPEHRGKIEPAPFWRASLMAQEIESYQHLGRPFEKRDIELLFSASCWGRWKKNFPLLCQIADRLQGMSIHVAGQLSLPQRQRLGPAVTCHGHLDRCAHFDLLGRSRCVASPSCLDIAPGLLFEAAALGCNAVASPNCGNSAVCHPELVCDLDGEAFADAVRRACSAPMACNLESFLEFDAAAELVEIAAALT